jgi:hypothetical protein
MDKHNVESEYSGRLSISISGKTEGAALMKIQKNQSWIEAKQEQLRVQHKPFYSDGIKKLCRLLAQLH